MPVVILAGSLDQSAHVRHHDEPVAAEANDIAGLEARQLAADGFDGESQIVGHVGTRERQLESRGFPLRPVAAGRLQAAPGEHVEKARHLLLGSLAAEEKHPVARRVKLVQRMLEKPLLQAGILAHEPLKCGIGEGADLDFGCCFRRIRIVLGIGPAQEIRCEKQANDLLAPVGQGLGELDGAGNHIRKEVDWLLVRYDGLSGGDLLAMRDLRQLADLGVIHGTTDGLVTNRAVLAALQDVRQSGWRRAMHV